VPPAVDNAKYKLYGPGLKIVNPLLVVLLDAKLNVPLAGVFHANEMTELAATVVTGAGYAYVTTGDDKLEVTVKTVLLIFTVPVTAAGLAKEDVMLSAELVLKLKAPVTYTGAAAEAVILIVDAVLKLRAPDT
jgi:hypothetical protein